MYVSLEIKIIIFMMLFVSCVEINSFYNKYM